MKLRFLLSTVLMGTSAMLSAQSDQKGPVAAGGDSDPNSPNGSFSYSVGQIDYLITEASGATSWPGLQVSVEFITLRVDELPELIDLQIFPNPTTHWVNINFSVVPKKPYKLSVFDAQGRLIAIHTLQSLSNQIDVSGFSAGTYLAELHQENRSAGTFRIVKTH